MKPGTIKTVNKKGLKFDLIALDEQALILDEDSGKYTMRQIGEVISEVPENEYGIEKGTQILLAE